MIAFNEPAEHLSFKQLARSIAGCQARRLLLGVVALLSLAMACGAIAAEQTTDEKVMDIGFYLEALASWGPAFEEPGLNQEYDRLKASPRGAPGEMEERVNALQTKLDAALAKHRDALYAAAKQKNSTMRFHAGLARDYNPSPMLDEWMLFHLNAFRMGAASETFMGKGTKEERFARAGSALEKAAGFGAVAVVSSEGGRPTTDPPSPVDFVFNNDFLPQERSSFFRSSFNSAPLRRALFPILGKFAEAMSRYPAAGFMKIGNEPFWTARPSPAVDFGQAAVGCSPGTFQTQVLKKYPDFDAWKSALLAMDRTVIEKNKGQKAGHRKFKTMAEFFPWKSLSEMTIPAEDIAGLTFVQYLKDRYASLDELNRAWFGDDRSRWFAKWDAVFPPSPVIEPPKQWTKPEVSIQSNIPEEMVVGPGAPSARAPKGMEAAWVDWLSYQPAAINNYLVSARASILKSTGTRLPISTNCITDHFLHNFNNMGAVCGLNPWDTPKGLDTLAIDFYPIRYMQGYLRSMAGVANGRPIQIYEAGGASGLHHTGEGADPQGAAYMTLYSYAYGADLLLFWRRDAKLEPVIEIEIARAMKAMSDPDLQKGSHPVTDGTAMLYSQDSLYLAQALDGTPERMLWPFQVGLRMAQRLHLLFDFYSDRQVAETGIPGHIKVLVLPGAFAVSDQFLERLEGFVKTGGRIVVGSDFASCNGHGKSRSKPAWLAGEQVLTIPESDWLSWSDKGVANQVFHPYDAPMPAWGEMMDRFIQEASPRVVDYLGSDGNQSAASISGVRKSDSALYVFVNPGANDVTLKAGGKYKNAVNLYSGSTLPVIAVESETKVPGVSGPAIIRLTKDSTP